jgi:hypothetical protein
MAAGPRANSRLLPNLESFPTGTGYLYNARFTNVLPKLGWLLPFYVTRKWYLKISPYLAEIE